MLDNSTIEFWGKKDKGSDARYPLLFHMFDAAAVTQELWDRALQPFARTSVANGFGLPEAEAGKLVSFLAGLHDFGKASPRFQCQDEATRKKLDGMGFDTRASDKGPGHGAVTALLLRKYLPPFVGAQSANSISVALGGHHGVFPRSEDVLEAKPGERAWDAAQKSLFEDYKSLCSGNVPSSARDSFSPALLMFLAGLVSVADWIASNENWFPYEVSHAIEDHAGYARRKASLALQQMFWNLWQPATVASSQMQDLFDSIKTERPLQTESVALAKALGEHPGMVIIEAPTGEGKTEAAIYIADHWLQALGQKGLYFALPTMATSDQMFGRVRKYLERRYPGAPANYMLLHGHADLSAEFRSIKQKAFNWSRISINEDGNNETAYDRASPGVVASEWFTYRKRGLLSPFGVGTVDQILLAALQTRHVFVRLFGLANKTVIIDEVHAYDAYMSTLLERLLEWLAALGTSVVMLSATLPVGRRDAFLKSYRRGLLGSASDGLCQAPQARYPRISWTTGAQFSAKTIEASPDTTRRLCLKWVDGELPSTASDFDLGKQLEQALLGGGCAAVICNTVDRAQEVYLALKDIFPGMASDGLPVLDLLHARYMFGDRKRREQRSLIRFSKPGEKVQCEDGTEHPVTRPDKAVLVSTQIIEQSLDLDFDLMVTDMAPADLLLQRAGRLHRHRRDAPRPEKLKEPELWIRLPKAKDSVPDFGGGTEAVYDYHVLLRTWMASKDKMAVAVPEDVETLIEAVYGECNCPEDYSAPIKEKWKMSKDKLDSNLEQMRDEAERRRIKWPWFSGQLWRMTYDPREEDDPSVHPAHQALTRLAEPSVNVICLYGTSEAAFLYRSHTQGVDLRSVPSADMTRRLLMSSVSISARGLVKVIAEGEKNLVPLPYRQSPLLRHHYLAFFDRQSVCNGFSGYTLSCDEERGLLIRKAIGRD